MNLGFADFKQRYATYDLSALFNQIELLEKDPRTNRLYFSFLNEVQFRTLQDGIKRRAEQERFGFNVGTRLYRKILQGDTVGPRIVQGDAYDPKAPVNMSSPLSGQWPPLSPALPTGALATDLAEGSQRLMDYLRRQGYCKARVQWMVDFCKGSMIWFDHDVLMCPCCWHQFLLILLFLPLQTSGLYLLKLCT